MTAFLSRPMGRAHVRALLLTSTALFTLSTPSGAQEAKKTDLPPVSVEQPTIVAPAAKKTVQKKKAPPPVQQAAEPAPATATSATPANEVTPVALGTYNPALDLSGLKLPPATTITTAGPVQGYRALSAVSSTKTATPLEQIPQSIQVVPRSVIDDQTSITVSEVIQNVSNVQGPNSHSLGNTELYPYTIRGFGAQAWLDGLVMPFSLGDRDALANVERIEVLKGPAAILYGGGAGAPIGGAVNIISKLPTDKAAGAVGFTFGSDNFVQPYFDINQPVTANGTVLFRVTGQYTATDSFIDVLEQDRYSFNPTLTLTDKTDTTLTIQGHLSKSEQQTYQGLPATGTILGGFKIDRDLFIGPSDIPRGYSEVEGITVTLDHKINDIWSANVKARWSQGGFAQFTQLALGADAAGALPAINPSTWLLGNTVLAEEIEEISVNPNVQAKFNLGASRNTVLVGGDYSRVTEHGLLAVDYLGNGCAAFFGVDPCLGLVGPTANLTIPSFTTPYADPRGVAQYQDVFGFDQVVTFNDVENVFKTKGVYGQIQSTFYDRVHVLAGVRAAHVSIEQIERSSGVPQETVTDAYKPLPRAGIVVDLMPGLSAFGSYSEGIRAVPRQLPGGRSEPEFSEQREVGFKFNLDNQISGTVAYFEIDRDNVVVNLGGLAGIALAKQRGRGYEADALWQPNRNWQVLASYGFTDVEFADGLLGAPAGNRFPLVPEHSGRFWINYMFDQPMLRGWSMGAGIYASSGQFVDAANQYKTDGYYTVDAKIGYDNDKFSAAFNVKNLTGEEYFVPYSFLGGQVAPGDDRAYYGSLIYKY
ncbi:MAG: TonB-dependent receptor [Hyphomicrobium sp.]|jgi:iron complex outermembrane receptor protein